MNSNNKQQASNILFVKQFFGNFFQRKSMLQTLSELSNGISVLQALIQHFEQSKGIKNPHKLAFKRPHLKGQFINIVQQQGKAINQNMQDLYKRLKYILQDYYEGQKLQCPKIRQITEFHSDSQLYDMISDYKNQNKRQKQLIKKIEQEQGEMKKILQKVQEEKVNLGYKMKQKAQLYESAIGTIMQNEREMLKLTRKVEELQAQRQQLQEKLSDVIQISKNVNYLERLNLQLTQKLKTSQQNERRANKKFDCINDIVKAKIKQKDQQWENMISKKLDQNSIYQKASCHVFKQFMNSIKVVNS